MEKLYHSKKSAPSASPVGARSVLSGAGERGDLAERELSRS